MTTEAAKNAQTVIHQSTQVLVQQVWEANARADKLNTHLQALRLQHGAPRVETREFVERIAHLEGKVREQQEFMRLKDDAKRKVEQRNLSLVEESHSARYALQDSKAELAREKQLREEYSKRVENLEQIILLGRKGLEAERAEEW